jgi:DnaK suppressor protein
LERFQERLLEMRRAIAGEAATHTREGFSLGTDGTQDVGDDAANSYARQLLLGRSEREREALRAIDEALDRIEEGSYGECEGCGESIGEARLEVVPHATLCVECKSLDEATGR